MPKMNTPGQEHDLKDSLKFINGIRPLPLDAQHTAAWVNRRGFRSVLLALHINGVTASALQPGEGFVFQLDHADESAAGSPSQWIPVPASLLHCSNYGINGLNSQNSNGEWLRLTTIESGANNIYTCAYLGRKPFVRARQSILGTPPAHGFSLQYVLGSHESWPVDPRQDG